MANRSGNALDYYWLDGAAQPQETQPERKQKPENVVNLPTRKHSFWETLLSPQNRRRMSWGLLVVAAVGVMGLTLVNNARINEATGNLNKAQVALQEAQQEYSQLSMEVRAKVNIRDVEDYAVNVLGMQLPEGYQIEPISPTEGDKTVIYEGAAEGRDMTKDWRQIRSGALNVLAYFD